MLFIVYHKMRRCTTQHTHNCPRIIIITDIKSSPVVHEPYISLLAFDLDAPTSMSLLRKKAVPFSDIITVRDMLLVCSFLAVQRHVLGHDGADLRIHVTP